MQTIGTLVLIALAIIAALFVVKVVTGILALIFHLLIPALIVVGIVYVIAKVAGAKGLGGGNKRSLM